MSAERAIILIGMPGAGKSTLGLLLAKAWAMPFIDTDLLIQERVDMTLQDYLDRHGYLALRELEQQVLLDARVQGCVVATGGSAVYSAKGMRTLKQQGLCVYLCISPDTLLSRVNNQNQRGLACEPGTSLVDLYWQRVPLYERYCDIKLVLDNKDFDQSLNELVAALKKCDL